MEHADRRIIAVCASWEDEENLNLFLSHFIRATEPRGFLPLCVTFDRSGCEARGEAAMRELVDFIDLPNLAGLILFGEMIRSDALSHMLIRRGQEKKIPVFMLERQYAGCINTGFDYRAGFAYMIRHIVEEHRCRDVVMVAGVRGNPFSEERIALCRDILRAAGGDLPPERVLYGDYWDLPTFHALDDYFASGGAMPGAFICANDSMAIAVCMYLAERGVRVPEDVLVSGFDGISYGERHAPTITTAIPDFASLCDGMLNRVERWDPVDAGKTETHTVPYLPSLRQSCGCGREGLYPPEREISSLIRDNLEYSRNNRALGDFVRRTLSMDSLEALTRELPPLFSLWPQPYCCVSVADEAQIGQAKTIFHALGGRIEPETRFDYRALPIPDFDAVAADPEVRILLAHPLQNGEMTMGYLFVGLNRWSFRAEKRFEEQALFLATALSAVFGNHRLKKANDAILRMAEHDFLTDLYNRRGFLRELERRLDSPEAQEKTLTLYSMDIDRLKMINDRYGHQEGDHAIQCMGRALRTVVAEQGICARYGGDEFAFALLTDGPAAPLEQIRSRLETAARDFCGPREYLLSASLGACAAPAREHPPLEKMIAASDQALYADKERRRAGR